MDFFIHGTPLPSVSMDSPAIVILGCSRKEAILKTISLVSKLPGVDMYSLYLSLGCVERIWKSVPLSSSSSLAYGSYVIKGPS